jgi:RHS repeat-associated protein
MLHQNFKKTVRHPLRMQIQRIVLLVLLVGVLGRPSANGDCCGGNTGPEKTLFVLFTTSAASVCPLEGETTPAWSYTVQIVREGGPLDGEGWEVGGGALDAVPFEACNPVDTITVYYPPDHFEVSLPSQVGLRTAVPVTVTPASSKGPLYPDYVYSGTVQISCTDTRAAYPKVKTVSDVTSFSFNATFATQGPQSITVTDGILSGTSGASVVENLPLPGPSTSSYGTELYLPIDQAYVLKIVTSGMPNGAQVKAEVKWATCSASGGVEVVSDGGDAQGSFDIPGPSSAQEFMNCSAYVGSANFVMGMSSPAGEAPNLVYEQLGLNAGSYTPKGLSFNFRGKSNVTEPAEPDGYRFERAVGKPSLQRITKAVSEVDSGGIPRTYHILRQVRSSSGLADIEPLPAGGEAGFSVKFYRQYHWDAMLGLYVPDAAPLKTVVFKDPSVGTSLSIEEYLGADLLHSYTFSQYGGEIALSDDWTNRQETKTAEPDGITTTFRTWDGDVLVRERTEERNANGFLHYVWDGPLNSAETVRTTYEYDANDKLLSISRSDGYFELYQNGKTYLPFENLTFDQASDSPRFTTAPVPANATAAAAPVEEDIQVTIPELDPNQLVPAKRSTSASGEVRVTYGDDVPSPWGGRVASEVRADGSSTTYAYQFGEWKTNKTFDSVGGSDLKTTATNSDGTVSWSVSDGESRLIAESDHAGVMTTYAYFQHGRSRTVTREALSPADVPDPTGGTLTVHVSAIPEQTTTYVYDVLGRTVRREVHSEGATQVYTWAYNVNGRLTGETNPYGSIVYELRQANVETGVHAKETRKVYAGSNADDDYREKTETTHFFDGGIESIVRNGVTTETHELTSVPSNSGAEITETITRGTGDEAIVSTSNAETAVKKGARVEVTSGVKTTTVLDAQGRTVEEWIGGASAGGRGVLKRSIVYQDENTVIETHHAAPDPDRVITSKTTYYQQPNGGPRWRIDEVLRRNGQSEVLLRSHKEKQSGFGLRELSTSIDTNALGGETTMVTTVDPAAHAIVTRTTQTLIGNASIQVTRAGMLQAYNTPAVQVFVKTDYDGFGREIGRSDPLTAGTVVTTYDPASGQVATISGGSSDTVANEYYLAGDGKQARLLKAKTVNGLTTRYSYTSLGQLEHVWGATYPLTYAYDSLGRLHTLSTYQAEPTSDFWFQETWPDSPPPASVTTWVYVDHTNNLWRKLDAAQKGPTYDYDSLGRLEKRTWARGVVTTYGYNLQNELRTIHYSDGTPNVAYTRNSAGVVTIVSDGAGTHHLDYNAAGQLTSETGLVQNTSLTHQFDVLGRPKGYVFTDPNTPANNATAIYTYRPDTGTMQQIQQGDAIATYDYAPNGWLDSIVNGPITTARKTDLALESGVPDPKGRLWKLATVATGSGATIASFTYGFDANGRRQTILREDLTQWVYGYNGRSEVTSGVKKASVGGAILSGYNFNYNYDAIGNRTTTNINNSPASYSPTTLNQYDQRTVPRNLDLYGQLTGSDAVGSTLRVNNQIVAKDANGNFAQSWVYNTPGPVWQKVQVAAIKPKSDPNSPDQLEYQKGHVFLPADPEQFTYDDDGNLRSDGRWVYAWDAENRLIGLSIHPAALGVGVPAMSLQFLYDARARRTQKLVLPTLDGTSTQERFEYVYDGWNLLAEYHTTGAGNTASGVTSYGWGLDLSGTLSGAGGVGGILWQKTNNIARRYYAIDGNGNVAAMTAGADRVALYVYGPFGESCRFATDAGAFNPFRWSSQYLDADLGLVLYPLRAFNPSCGRWLSPDPLEEEGGFNLHSFVENNPVNAIDPLGLVKYVAGDDLEQMARDGAAEALRLSLLPVMGWRPTKNPPDFLESSGPPKLGTVEHIGVICQCARSAVYNPDGKKYVRSEIWPGSFISTSPYMAKRQCEIDMNGTTVAIFHSHPWGDANDNDKSVRFDPVRRGQPNPYYNIRSFVAQFTRWKLKGKPVPGDAIRGRFQEFVLPLEYESMIYEIKP